jgi:hypothetical protein
MSPSLPPEILDRIVDHLHDEPTTLKTCCVVSKSWIQRTRTHLFVSVDFYPSTSSIDRWKKAFLDPSNSPARYTRTLSIRDIPVATAADTDVGGWVRTFHNLVHLRLGTRGWGAPGPLVPFHGLSPTLRSLDLTSTSPEVLDLICSFPLLVDLTWMFLSKGSDVWDTPSTSPKLTGSLNLKAIGGIRPGARRLLDLPGGLHFTHITVGCLDEDVEPTMGLVSRCSDTLESFEVSYYAPGAFPPTSTRVNTLRLLADADKSGRPSLDFSKATKLKELVFRCGEPNVQRIVMALQTVQSKSLQQITIHPYGAFAIPVKEAVRQEWQDLDHLLVQFWTSLSIRPRIACEAGIGGDNLRAYVPNLLPELTRRGLVDLVEYLHRR